MGLMLICVAREIGNSEQETIDKDACACAQFKDMGNLGQESVMMHELLLKESSLYGCAS